MRCQQARITRRTRTISRRTRFLRWWLWRDLDNWTRLHGSLSQQTHAKTQGLANHRWSVGEYGSYPVHVNDLIQAIWAEDRQTDATSNIRLGTSKPP